jgi:hypothetical protein
MGIINVDQTTRAIDGCAESNVTVPDLALVTLI